MDKDTKRLARGVGMTFREAGQKVEDANDDFYAGYFSSSHKIRHIADDDSERYSGDQRSGFRLD